jgi:glycosidase
MATQVFSSDISQIINAAQSAGAGKAQVITLAGANFNLPQPFPSPIDWRDCTIYLLMLDRFNNTAAPPLFTWNVETTSRQGGTFNGVTAQLPYIRDLGVKAIWITPVLKNPSDKAGYSYYGYGAQDFINLEKRFASDGTLNTAEKEYRNLIDTAHKLGLYVIQDIVINHTAQVFDYMNNGALLPPTQPPYLNAPLGQEPSIEWFDGTGAPNPNWINQLPAGVVPGPDDFVWPAEFQDKVFFRRQGQNTGQIGPSGFIPGDFAVFRQLVAEYDATQPGQAVYRAKYGANPVLAILIRCYQYLIAKYDIDAFRIDTAQYVEPAMVENFSNAIREYALSLGKKNFFAFGEIWNTEATINSFVGRHSSVVDSGGLDAAMDYPLFYVLTNAVKGFGGVDAVYSMFNARNIAEENLVSSHAEVGRYFVSFIDNHDQYLRFNTPTTPGAQVTQALACLYALQGIPCLYYGTEQGLTGTINPTAAPEVVREALWGKPAPAFDETNPFYIDIQRLISLRSSTPALRYGRLYFREVSLDGYDFGQSFGVGGLIAFSRILCDTEVVVVANTNTTNSFQGFVLIDLDVNRDLGVYNVAYSNLSAPGAGGNALLKTGVVLDGPQPTQATSIACLYVILQPMEVQILM